MAGGFGSLLAYWMGGVGRLLSAAASTSLSATVTTEPWLSGKADTEPWLEGTLQLNRSRSWGAITPSTEPWVWNDSDVALYVVADAQPEGDTTVRSLVGPTGTLLSGTTLDPSYPKRFAFGETTQRGITFGDVLLDTLNAPFTVAFAIEIGDGPAAPNFQEIPLVSKWELGAGIADYIGFEIYGLAGDTAGQALVALQANMKFTTGVWTNYDYSSPLLPGLSLTEILSLPPGRYTLGFSYDWDAPRGSRTAWWFQGEPIPPSDVFENATGTETHPIVTTAPFQFSGDFGLTDTESPEGGKALIVTAGIKDDDWHRGFHAEMVALGWTND